MTVQQGGVAQDAMRKINLSMLVSHLHRHGSTTRTDLADLTGLTRSTVGNLVRELKDLGLVTESAALRSGRPGRPSQQIEPVPDGALVLAALIDVDAVDVGVFTLGGAFRSLGRERRPRGPLPPDEAVSVLRRLAHDQVADIPAGRLVAVGVGIVGVVRREDGFVHRAPNLGWRDVPLAGIIAAELGLGVPVVVGNEADLGALAEHTRGAGVGSRNLIYLSGGVGVGGGIIANSAPLGGSNGYAGEVGHMTVNVDGRRCGCGALGCWETEIGEGTLFESTGCSDIAEVIGRAAQDDGAVVAAIESLATWLGIGISTLINIFDVDTIVLGGHFERLYPHLRDVVHREVAHRVLTPDVAAVRISPALLGEDAALYGAAELALGPLLEDPLPLVAAGPSGGARSESR